MCREIRARGAPIDPLIPAPTAMEGGWQNDVAIVVAAINVLPQHVVARLERGVVLEEEVNSSRASSGSKGFGLAMLLNQVDPGLCPHFAFANVDIQRGFSANGAHRPPEIAPLFLRIWFLRRIVNEPFPEQRFIFRRILHATGRDRVFADGRAIRFPARARSIVIRGIEG
jgi:hypothetical protein